MVEWFNFKKKKNLILLELEEYKVKEMWWIMSQEMAQADLLMEANQIVELQVDLAQMYARSVMKPREMLHLYLVVTILHVWNALRDVNAAQSVESHLRTL